METREKRNEQKQPWFVPLALFNTKYMFPMVEYFMYTNIHKPYPPFEPIKQSNFTFFIDLLVVLLYCCWRTRDKCVYFYSQKYI